MVIYVTHPRAGFIVLSINILLIGLLWFYRVAQEKWGNSRKTNPTTARAPNGIGIRDIGIILACSLLAGIPAGFAGGVLAGMLNL